MRNYLRKPVWHRMLREGTIDRNQNVKMWVLPHGVICDLVRVGGMDILRNGTYDAVNSFLARELAEAGLHGEILFYTTRVIPQTLSKWLTYWLSGDPDASDPELNSVTITTLGQYPTKPLPFQVNVVEPLIVKAGDVFDTIKAKSRNQAVSQFLVETENEVFRLEPVRKTDATLLAVTDYGVVCRSTEGHTFLCTVLSRRIQAQLAHYKLSLNDIIGTTLRIEYTMYTEGNRLCNYKSPIAYRALALDSLGDWVSTTYDGPSPFKTIPTQRPALLTVTRCNRAEIYEENGVIYGLERETGLTLFRFRRGPEYGRYAAVFEREGEQETWLFDSDFSVDVIDPEGFIASVGNQVFYATGYSLVDVKLYYPSKELTTL